MDVTLASLAMDIDVGKADPAIERLTTLKKLSAELETQFGATGKAAGGALGSNASSSASARTEASMRSLIRVYGEADEATGDFAMSQEAAATLMLRNAAAQVAAAKEADQLARSVERLTSSYDPLAGEILKTNRALSEADALYERGALSAQQYAAATDGLKGKLNNLQQVHGLGAKGMRLQAHEAANLGRQFADVGVQLASMQNPLMVLVQQGPQIADVFSTAAARGVSFKMVLADIYVMAAPFLAVLLPIAAAAAAIGGAFAISAQQINKDNSDLIKGLGLTADQMENVKHKTVTMGDVAVGTFNAAKGALMDAFGPQLKAAGKAIGDFYQQMVDDTVKELKFIVGGFVGAYEAIKATWSLLPAAMGDLTISTANLVLSGVEKLINGSIGLINILIAMANGAAEKVGLTLRLPTLDSVAVTRLANQYTGAMSSVAEKGMAGFNSGSARGAAMVDDAMKRISDETLKVARARILKEAGKAHGGATSNDNGPEDVDEFSEAMARFNKEAAERNRLAREYDKFKPYKEIDEGFAAGLKQLDILDRVTERLDQIHDHAIRAGQGLREAFGSVGGAISDAVNAMTRYGAENAALNANLQAADNARAEALKKAGANSEKIAEANARYHQIELLSARERAQVEVETYGGMAAAAKGFFDQKSTAYKVLEGAEKAFRAVQFAMAVKAMVVDAAETGSALAKSALRAASYATEAVAKAIASVPFPFNLAAGAATAAALAALGVKIMGGGGGGGASAPSAEDIQAGQGTGSVLGDRSAKSDSIARALDQSLKTQNRDLEYSSQMVQSLRAIEGNISAVADVLARQLGGSGALSTDALGLGTSASGPGLLTKILAPISAILPGLFGKKTTTTLLDQGLQFSGQSLGSITSGGLAGSTYQDVQTQTKKKAFGITYSNKSSTSTQSASIDADLQQQLGLLIGSLKLGVLTAAGELGVTGAAAVLDAFQVNLGKISFKDLTGAQIEEQLTAVFGKLGDDMAAAVVPGLAQLQKVGEGTFETLTRVAREYQVVDVTLQSIGKTFPMVGLASLGARDRLVELVGGLDEFASRTSFFAENFLSEAEQLAPVQKAVTIEMARLGFASVQTKDQFKDLVLGLDVSTEEGAKLYAALMAVAPAFAKVVDAAADAGAAVRSLGEQITDAIGSAASLLDEQISASSSASNTAKAAAANYRALNQSLKDSITSLRGGDLSTLSPTQKLAEQGTGLDAIFGKALSGDVGALAKLPQVATDFLNASRDVNASSTAYASDFNRVMDMLAQAGVAANADAGIMDYQSTLLDVQTGVLKEIRDNLIKPTPDLDLLARQANLLETIGTLLTDQTTQLVTVNSSLVDANGTLIQGNSIVSAQTGQLVAVQSASTISLTQAQVAAVAQTIAAQQVTAAQLVASNDNGTALLIGSNATQTGALTAAQTGATAQVTAAQASAAGQIVGGNASSQATTAAQIISGNLSGVGQLVGATLTQTGSLVGSNNTVAGQIVGGQVSTSGQIVTAQQAAANAIAAAQSLLGVNLGSAIGQQTGQINASQSQTAGQIVLSQLGLNSLLTTGNTTAAQQNGLVQAGNLLINAQTGVVTTLDGHVVTGNTLINAQTGQVTAVTGAVKDQTGAVVVGNQSSDAIKNINALNNQYSEDTLKALVASNVTQDATFASLLTGNNTMVALLSQIRDLTAAKATQDAINAAKAAADAAAAAAAAAQAAAAAAAQQAAQQAAAAAATAAQQPNWSSYLVSNPDVMAEYNRLSKNYLKTLGIYTAEQFGEYHWNSKGQAEGRKPYAKGGVFTNGIVSQPTFFDASIMGEGGRPEAIVPLVRGPQGLGVRTSGSDGASWALVAGLLREIKNELRADKGQRSAVAMATLDKLDTLIDTQQAQTRATRRAA